MILGLLLLGSVSYSKLSKVINSRVKQALNFKRIQSSNVPLSQGKIYYGERWGIEVFFSACINLEKATNLGFTELYGNEVNELRDQNCT